MNWITDLLLNYYLISFLAAWIISILIKAILRSKSRDKKLSISEGLRNGGMPSSHCTAVSAITTAVFLMQGPSSLFFVSLVFSLIVISDAFRLRYNVGVQGEAINLSLRNSKQKKIDVVYGHTFMQAVFGIILGGALSILIFFLYFII